MTDYDTLEGAELIEELREQLPDPREDELQRRESWSTVLWMLGVGMLIAMGIPQAEKHWGAGLFFMIGLILTLYGGNYLSHRRDEIWDHRLDKKEAECRALWLAFQRLCRKGRRSLRNEVTLFWETFGEGIHTGYLPRDLINYEDE